MRRIGEAIGSRRQHIRELAGAKEVLLRRLRDLDAEKDAAELAVGSGHQQMLSRARLIARGAGENAGGIIQRAAAAVPAGAADKPDRHRLGSFAVRHEYWMHALFRQLRSRLLARRPRVAEAGLVWWKAAQGAARVRPASREAQGSA